MKKVLIIGGNSDIALACAHEYKKRGCHVILTGHKLNELSKDFETHFLNVSTCIQNDYANFQPDIVLYAAGKLGTIDNMSKEEIRSILEVNFENSIPILTYFFDYFKSKNSGTIVGISSVAAVRGKSSTLIYGAAKSGFDSFLSGLRNSIQKSKVRVLTIRPGFVKTKMIRHLSTPKSLTASAEQVARIIVKHSLNGNRSIVYVKSIWRPIMFIIRNIPEFVFKKMNL